MNNRYKIVVINTSHSTLHKTIFASMTEKITPHAPTLQDYRLELTRIDQHPTDLEETEKRLELLRSMRDALQSSVLPETGDELRDWAADKVMLCSILHLEGDTTSTVGIAFTEGDAGSRQVAIEAPKLTPPVVDALYFSAENALARWVSVDIYRDELTSSVETVESPVLVDAA